jgi:soluble cytochrome b562
MGKSSEMFMQMQEKLSYIKSQNEQGYYSNLDALLEMREYRYGAENIIEITKLFENNKISEISRDANANNNKYNGFQITEVSGRKTYDFSNIPEVKKAKENLSNIEDKYKSMFVAKINGNPHANISEDGEQLPLPELKIGKSFITVKKI